MKKVLSLLAFVALTSSLTAQTAVTWDGSDNSDFATGGNWIGDIAPTNDTISNIAAFSGTATANQPNLAANRSIYGFDFQSGGWTLGGAQFTLGAGGISSTGNNEITAGLALSGNSTFSSASGGKLTINSSIYGKNGGATFGTAANAGTVELAGNADNGWFSTTVNYGTLILNKSGTAGSSVNNLTVDSGATVQFGSNLTSRNTAGGRGQIYGTATVNGTMDLNGQGLTSDDTFNWGMGGLSGSGTVTNTGSGSAQISVQGGTFTGDINEGSSAVSLRVHNGGTFVKGGGGNYSGGTTITGGSTLKAQNGDALGTGDITIDDGTLANSGGSVSLYNRNITVGAGGATVYASGGYLSLRDNTIFNGSGTLAVANGNGQKVYMDSDNSATFTGDVHINGDSAVLSIKANSIALDSGTANLILEDGGRLEANNADLNLTGRNLQLNGTGGTINTSGRAMTLTGSTLSGTGALSIAGGGSTAITTAGNTLSGAVTLDGIHVGLGAKNNNGADVLGTGNVTLKNGARLKNNNNVQTINNNLEIGSGGGKLMAGWGKNVNVEGVVSGSGTLTIDGDSGFIVLNNANNTFDGNIAFTNSFGYGEGKLRLASLGGESYDGTISGESGAQLELTGEILLGGDSTYQGLTKILSGGAIGGNGSIDGNLTIDAGGQLVFSTTDTLGVAGAVSLDSTFGIDDLIGLDSSVADGTYTLIGETASTFSHIENYGYDARYNLGGGKEAYFEEGSLQVTVIPEPAVLSFVVATGLGFLFIRRRFTK